MQAELAFRFFNAKSEENIKKLTNEHMKKWIEEYSTKFREVLEENPEIKKEYLSDKEKILSKVEEKLYEKV